MARRKSGLHRWLPLIVLLLVAGAVVEEWQYGATRMWIADRYFAPDPLTQPAEVPAPETLALPALPGEVTIAAPVGLASARKGRVRAVLRPGLRDDDLGRHVVTAVDGLDGRPLQRAGRGAFTPASTTKILTTTAALQVLGPDHVFTTRVLGTGRRIVLVGGGDPYLASKPAAPGEATYPVRADVVTLAHDTALALKAEGRRAVRLDYDATLFTGPPGSEGWRADYLSDQIVSPISALWVDEGRADNGWGRVADPARTAAETFAAALAKQGIRVKGVPRSRAAPAGADELAAVDSAPLSEIVERILDVSDNEAVEVLGHQIGLATHGEGSFAAGVDGVLETLDSLGVRTTGARLYDGSGLSRRNRLLPETLLDTLRVAASPEHPGLRAVVTGLPVAAFTGSLRDRFAEVPLAARGLVRAKTGTLTGVSSLAGFAVDRDGSTSVFVLAADKVAVADTLGARDALDALAASLADCRCG